MIYEISRQTIDEYKDNTDVLRGLSMNMKSGKCSLYDMALYEGIQKVRKEEKERKEKIAFLFNLAKTNRELADFVSKEFIKMHKEKKEQKEKSDVIKLTMSMR